MDIWGPERFFSVFGIAYQPTHYSEEPYFCIRMVKEFYLSSATYAIRMAMFVRGVAQFG